MDKKWFRLDATTGRSVEVVMPARQGGKTEEMRQAAEAKGYKRGLLEAAEMVDAYMRETLEMCRDEHLWTAAEVLPNYLPAIISRLRARAEDTR